MCFSASASFTAAAGLSLAGLVSLKKVRSPQQIMLASIPLLFSLQQFSEGLVWLSFNHITSSALQQVASSIFLTFALIIWPCWIPSSLVLLEKNLDRKRILQFLCILGFLWSIALAWYITRAEVIPQVYASNMCYSISTFNIFSDKLIYSILIYLVPVILPFFISTLENMWIFGLAGLISCFITYLLWFNCFLSVWCFFAAILSFMLIGFFPESK